ncbi:hypothetical protein LPB67_11100 [Undibacterium sp. Jales W-56]|uniref:hypothetical protein n=1 Tax=Undibacterium sp. Jales W-56 TaxID=2897325 RepID=UPI0021D384B4|nr:hypothetical protein [Undibacterium sp. Jales W-56]MCU6434318.1 hypothetical protein [Undibacterium sp. Jales W-56]
MKPVSNLLAVLLTSAMAFPAQAAPAVPVAPGNNPPDLDLNIQYYSKVLTAEGVTREARYEEKMLRRPGHVWVTRVLPKNAVEAHDDDSKIVSKNKAALPVNATEHKHFNHVVIPRHVILENNKARVEYVDAHSKDIVAIPPSEYENVNFDGSWDNAFYLLDPKLVKTMPYSAQVSPVPGARWREREKNGVYQRVLWDEQKQIPLVIESGDKAATFYRRVDVKPLAGLTRELPWLNLKGYAQKEYSDFLD